jgi:glycosyltransferase involved in cell wall biosynthesis
LGRKKIDKLKKYPRVILGFNGFQYNITGAVADYFVTQGYQVYKIMNPLFKNHGGVRKLVKITGGLISEKKVNTLLPPPISYFFDFLFPFVLPTSEIAIGFNPVITLRYLLERKFRKNIVIHWNIDYTPRRFKNLLLNFIYGKIDKFACKHSNLHVDISLPALNQRFLTYELEKRNTIIMPVGVWEKDILECAKVNWYNKELLFIGNLTPNQDILLLLRSFKCILKKFPNCKLHIIGSGPQLKEIQAFLSQNKDVGKRVLLHGELRDQEISKIAAVCCVAFALYSNSRNSFSNFSDSSKIKQYLTFGLPLIITSNLANANSLRLSKVAKVVPNDLNIICEQANELLSNFELWNQYATNATEYIKSYEWSLLLIGLHNSIREIKQQTNFTQYKDK